ncbi:MAG: hypothetical protein Crog4KO_23900 [Crocinitomicaceae bacterium]
MKTILRYILVLLGLFFISDAQAQRAKDGSYTATGANEVLNTYTNLTANASAGATTITVANNAMTGGAFGGTPLQQGDLIMIYQVQGANVDINNFPVIAGWGPYTWPQSYFSSGFGVDPQTFGQVLNEGTMPAGRFERVEVLSTSGTNQITLTCGLSNAYVSADHAQIIRIPRLDDLTVNAGAAIVPTLWDGTTGGVVALEVDGTLTVNVGGTISATGYGFRGGELDADFTSGIASTGGSGADRFLGSPSGFEGSEKGESIFGYHTEYDGLDSRYGVAPIANGGGGGGFVNAGGGGGSNAEVAAGAFNAHGNPVAGYAAAYGQDPLITSSSGGGQGGYALSQSNQNAGFTGPNQAAWAGDGRKNCGGWGGHPLTYNANKIFFGGGGGAGDQDSDQGGAGGRGGGVVYIINYGTIAGSGEIQVNGGAGQNSNPTGLPLGANAYRGNDGAGGGGGAGTVYIENAAAIPNTIDINAIGGDGGDQNLLVNLFQLNEAGGPGGAGSGGIIRFSSGAPTQSVVSGVAGVTTSTDLTEFPPNGSTEGSTGDANLPAPYYDLIPNDVTICAGQMAAPSVTVQGSYTGTLNWYTVQYGGTPIAGQTNQLTYNVSPGTTTTYWVGVCPGTFRVPVTVTVTAAPTLVTTDPAPICAPGTADITLPAVTAGSDPGTLTYWQDNGATITQATPTAVGAGWHYIQLDAGGGCTTLDSVFVTINPQDDASFTSGDYCEGGVNTISGVVTPGGTFTIQSQTGSGGVTIAPSTGVLSNGVAGDQITIEYTTSGPCPNSSTQVVNVLPLDDASFTSGDFCASSVNTISGVATPGGTFSIASQTGSGGVTIAPGTGILSNYFAGDQVTIEYTTSGTCPNSSQVVVNVTNLDDASFTSGDFCANSVNTISGVVTPGGTFSIAAQTGSGGVTIAPGTGILSNYFAGDQVTIEYTTPAGGCQNTSQVVVNVLSLDDASFTSGDYCEGGSNTISGVATPGGTFTIQSQTGSGGVTIAPGTGILSNVVAGDQVTIEYTTPAGGCQNSSTQVVNVLAPDDATFVTNDFCVSSVNVVSGVATPGGTFSIASQTGSGGVTIAPGTGILSNYFAGDQVTIEYTTAGPCPNSSQVVVNVTNLDDASFTIADFCASSVNTVSGVATPGGTFAIISQTGSGGVTIAPGTGILSNYFAGDQVTIEYTTPAGGCQNSSQVVVNVLNLDDASFTSGGYCEGGANTISGVATPGGTFTIQSQTGSGGVTIAPGTGILSNGVAGDQITIEYTTPAGGCQNSSTQVVNVLPLDDASFVSNDFCASGVNTISGVVTPGGTFSIAAQTGSGGVTIAPGTGILSNYFAGDQVTIQYTTPGGGCQNSSTQVVNVIPLPVITTGQTAITACNLTDGEITVSDVGNATGVVNWSGPTSGTSGAVTLPFTFGSLPPGTYDVTFTDNASGCTSIIMQETLTNPTGPDITPIGPMSDCDSVQLPAIAGTNLSGSQAYYDGAGGTGTMYSPGDWISSSITLYAYDISGLCSDEESFNITIQTIPVAAFTANPVAGCTLPHTVFFTDNSTLPDTWFWDFGDASTSTLQNPIHSYTSFGTFTVTLTVTDTIIGCSDQATTTITVTSAPVLDPITDITGCDSIQLPPITGTGLTGNEAYYTGSGGTGTMYAAGDWIYSSTPMYANDMSNPCTVEQAFNITVNPSPTISGPTTVCPTASITLNGTGVPDAVTPWSSSNTGVATVDNVGSVTGVSAGSTTITYLDANGCSNTYVVTVSAAPVLDPLAPFVGCDSIQLPIISGTGLTGNEAYYTGTGGTGTQYASGDWVSSTTPIYVNDLSNPCTIEQNTTITINNSPTISGGSTVCEGSTLALSGTGTPDPGTPWSSSNTGVATVDNTGLVTGVAGGTADITYTDNNGCSNTITVTVNPTPTISGNAPICVGATNTLTGSGTPDGTTPWSSSDVSVATVDNAGVVTGVAAGTATITYLEANGCSATEVVTVNAAPNLVITDPAAVCDPSTVDITVPAVTAGSDAGTLTYWTDNLATMTLATPNSVSTTNTYYIQLDDGNCTSIEAVNVTVNPMPTIALTDPAPVCDPSLVDLTDAAVTAGSDPGTFTYFDGGGTAVPDPTQVGSGTYFITLQDANGCQSAGQVTATVNPTPTLTVTDPAAVCEPTLIDLTAPAVTAGSDPGTLTYWDDMAATIATGTPNAVSQGTYYIQLEDANGCTSVEAVNATINPLDDASFTLTPTCDGATAIVLGTSGGTFTLLSATSATIDPTTGTVTGAAYNEVLDVEYTTNGASCPSSSTEMVVVDDCTPQDLIIPTAFTPGADGAHDTWEIVGLDNLYPNNRVLVFNRWGNKVFEHSSSAANPYSNNMWDGTYNGSQLPVASYYYIIETNDANSTEKFEGTVTILQ